MNVPARIPIEAQEEAMPRAPLMIRRDEIMLIEEAAKHAGKSIKTIRRWCQKYGIARQATPNSPLQISRIGLEMVLYGDWPALERLSAGDRAHRLVKWYREALGLPPE